MKKLFNSYIDTFEYHRNSIENCIHVSGWCYFKNGENVNYIVECNEEVRQYDILKVDRPDVDVQFQLNSKQNQFGFYIKIKLDQGITLTNFALKAKYENETQEILRLNRSQIKKRENNSIFYYSIDEFKTHDNMCFATGYVFAEGRDSPIEVEVLDYQKKYIEAKVDRIVRKDVMKVYKADNKNEKIGFRAEFSAKEKNPYYLRFKLGKEELEIPAEITLSFSQLTKSYIKAVSPERMKNAVRYLQKNGVRRFIHRVKLGPMDQVKLTYDEWFKFMRPEEKELENQKVAKFKYEPKISLIVATYNTPKKYLEEMINSVSMQTYSNWELCVADGSTNEDVKKYIEKNIQDNRIKFKRLDGNYGIAENMNAAYEMTSGEFVGFFDHDDLLTPNALYEVVKKLQDRKIEMVYSDEDKFDTDTKKFTEPHFKPDFSIDLLRSVNYICHFLVVKKSLIEKVGAFNKDYDGAQDYDFTLRAIEQLEKDQIAHIPMILYHWRMHSSSTAANPESKLYAFEAGKRAIEDHLKRQRVHAQVKMSDNLGMYDVTYEVTDNPLVSIVIPNKDHIEDLSRAIESIQERSSYRNLEFIIVENNSTEPETFKYYEEIQKKYENVKVVVWKDEFNYSAINNYGETFAQGDYILLLNNDTEMIEPRSIEDMLGVCQRKEVGAVGARLYYEDNTIQHAGVIIGLGGTAGHAFLNTPKEQGGYFNRIFAKQDVSAVTAACLMVKKSVFEEVGGLYDGLKVAFNDIDFCLKIRDAGYLIVYDPHAEFYHYESKSRGMEDTPEKVARFNREIETLIRRWKKIFDEGDPYYNPNLSLLIESYDLKMPEEMRVEKSKKIEREKLYSLKNHNEERDSNGDEKQK